MGKIRLGIYAITHFLVDLGCALLILGRVCPDHDPMTVILLYNLFAFAVQMPIGLLADRFGKCHLFAAAGCLLVLAGWLFPTGLPAAVTAGLGNAAFHVGGGLYMLNEGEHKAGPLGLFVSPGAFGVYFGARYADVSLRTPEFGAAWMLSDGSVAGNVDIGMLTAGAVLLLAAAVLLLLGKGRDNAPLELPRGDFRLWTTALCLFAVVILRSLLGLAADLPWKSGAGLGLAAVCAVAAGKAAGGYLADRFGARFVAFVSLGAAAVCFLGSSHPAAGLAALFLFNMTMPLTLWAMAELFPGAKGFSFGLLTFGLFLGFLPVYFGYGGMGSVTLALGAVLSLPLLAVGLRGVESPCGGKRAERFAKKVFR